MRFARTRIYGIVRRYFARLAILFSQKGILPSGSDIYYLTIDDVVSFIEGTAVTQDLAALAELRQREYRRFPDQRPDERFQTEGIPYLNLLQQAGGAGTFRKELRGIGCSSGVVEGEADIIFDPRDGRDHTGQILVAQSTDPGWVFLMIASKGIVVEKGSVLSHTAIIGRELGIPTVVGVRHATTVIMNGMRLSVDGSTGVIQWQ